MNVIRSALRPVKGRMRVLRAVRCMCWGLMAGAALGYVLPAVSIFIPASWTMFARSGAYMAGGYSIAVILPIELAIIACVLFIKPQIDSSAFIPRNQAK